MFDAAEADEILVPWSDDEEFNGSMFDPLSSMLSILIYQFCVWHGFYNL